MQGLNGRWALVTGASRGIGAAIAARLAEEGCQVIGTATTAAGAEQITQQLAGKGEGRVLTAAEPEGCAELFAQLKADEALPELVVNNAGLTRDNLLLRMSEQEWDEVLDANLRLVYRVSKAALRPMMKARYGRIVNISSVVGRMGNPGQSNYAASKAGLEGFTRALALEVASRNITANVVAPGFIDSDMTQALPDAQREELLARIPLGRMGSGAEIAAAVAFLLSEEAGYVTGQTLSVNGGMALH
ncbi:MAG: 3-oxoacyl-ACP reductase FabG [Pseudomonadota bacterium]